MVDVITDITINVSIEKVAAYAADPDNAPEWYQNIKSVQWKTDKPLRTGSQIAFVAHFIGKKLEYVYEVVTFRPNEILVMQTAQGPFPMQTTYIWKRVDGATTQMRLQNTGTPSGFSKIFTPLMSLMMKKANKKDLKKIKSILENNDRRFQYQQAR